MRSCFQEGLNNKYYNINKIIKCINDNVLKLLIVNYKLCKNYAIYNNNILKYLAYFLFIYIFLQYIFQGYSDLCNIHFDFDYTNNMFYIIKIGILLVLLLITIMMIASCTCYLHLVLFLYHFAWFKHIQINLVFLSITGIQLQFVLIFWISLY